MLNILIIEDDLLIALDQEFTLQDAGHKVVGTAATADEAVRMARAHDLDVIVADLRLADGSFGPDAVERIREHQDVDVIFVSGSLEPHVRAKLEVFSPLAMISKPFTHTTLINAVATAG